MSKWSVSFFKTETDVTTAEIPQKKVLRNLNSTKTSRPKWEYAPRYYKGLVSRAGIHLLNP